MSKSTLKRIASQQGASLSRLAARPQSGRELDALIEVSFFGGTCARCDKSPAKRIVHGVIYCSSECEKRISDNTLDDYEQYRAQFSHITSDTKLLIDKLGSEGYYFACDNRGGDPWWAEFANEDHSVGGQATAKTLEVATCLAALTLKDELNWLQ